MATFHKFEEIEAWQKARELTRGVYAISGQSFFAKDFGLRDQMRRACVSIMSNMAEGCERSGTGELIQFLAMAKGSAGEVRAQLYVAYDQGYVSKEEFDRLLFQAAQISRMVSGLINYLRESKLKGTKYSKAVESKSDRPNGR